jgi:two-component system cell cycle sensor histidine kinase/response regulator CckA
MLGWYFVNAWIRARTWEARLMERGVLEALFEAVPLGVYIFRLEDPPRPESLRVVFANRASAGVVGLDPKLVVGTLIGEHFPSSLDEGGPASVYRDVVVAQEPRDLGMISYGDEDGVAQQRFVVSAYPVDHESVAMLVENLSSGPRGTNELAAIVASAEDAILSKDLDGTILTWNASAERIYGYTAAEAIGGSVSMLLPDDRPNEVAKILSRLRGGERIEQFETKRVCKDGTVIDVSLTVSPVKDAQGVVMGAATIARDITERKADQARAIELASTFADSQGEQRKLEEQLRQSQRMEAIGSLATGVAHDFNNVLTVIRAASGILLSQVTDEAARDLARQIDQAALHAAALTGQLLAFGRQQILRPEPTDLNGVVASTLQMASRLMGERIRIETDYGSDLELIQIDRGQLEQVILNLCVNAADAMPDGGTLTVRTASAVLDESYAADHLDVTPGSYMVLQITDSGVGMDDETLARVFDPFYTTKTTGTGLGLSTVHGIVRQSNGHLYVYSEPGMGTTFKIYLPPADRLAAPAERPDVPPTTEASDGSQTVLVVEDLELLRPITARRVEMAGYSVLVAASAEDALLVAEAHGAPIDLLLTDVVLPGMSGRELSDLLLATNPATRVLFTSGYPADTIVRHGIVEGRINFIQKPYAGDELLRMIRQALAPE